MRAIHVVAPGDTLWSVSRSSGCTVEQLRAANPMVEPLHPGDRVQIPPCDDDHLYEVEPGDTLSELALEHQTTVEALRALNGLESATIRVGQTLRLPRTPVAPPRLIAGQSIGRPQRGALKDGQQLPHDPAYYRRRPHNAWAAVHVIDQVRAAVHRVRRRHPRTHRLAIGDLSAPGGGPIPEHHSHQSGRDVDLGLYYREPPPGYPDAFVPQDKASLNIGAIWSLIEVLLEQSKHPGGPEKIFLDYEIQKKLYEYARNQGASRSTLRQLFQYPDGRWARGRLVQHVRKHDDHIHVRFACPPADPRCH